MTPFEHRRKALKTLSLKPARVGLRTVVRKQVTTDIMHLVVGLSTEMTELLDCYKLVLEGRQNALALVDKTNAVEEFGDLFYYANALSHRLKVPMHRYGYKPKESPYHGDTPVAVLMALNNHVGTMLDLCKKVFYGKELNIDSLKATLTQVMIALDAASQLTGEKAKVIMDANIAKLAKRYPEGFFDSKAEANRNKEVEAATVDSAVAAA